MAFCTKCGKPLAEGAQFCASCGTPAGGAANDGSKRVQKFDGEIHKCPNCGAQLPSMAVRCPECGIELRGMKNTSAAVELKKVIDSVKPVYDEDGDLDEDETNKRIIRAMKNFVIPNTEEDMLELMIQAASYMKNDVWIFGIYGWDKDMQDTSVSAGYRHIMEVIRNKLSIVQGISPKTVEQINKIYDDTKAWATEVYNAERRKEKNEGRKESAKFWVAAVIFIAIIAAAHVLHFPFLIKWGLTVLLGIGVLICLLLIHATHDVHNYD